MLTYGSKVYRVEDSLSGDREEIRAESAIAAAIKYMKHDATLIKHSDIKGDVTAWYLEVERKR